ncbi:MAG: TldD/PmbA family protein [Desulfurococcaceae archaeon]|nr:TldD/PmbA family protein [Desulfurococcaceae archaeon]
MTKVLYSDSVEFSEEVTQIALRDKSIEINTNSSTVYGYRVNVDGCWYIVSSSSREALVDLKKKVSLVNLEKCGELAEGKIYRGNIEIGREYPEVEEVSKINQELCSEARGYNVTRCEIVITLRTVKRTIIRDQNDIASETKRIVEVEIGMVSQTGYGLYTLTSEFKVFIPWNPRDVIKSLDSLFREVVNRVLSVRILKPLKPYMYGRNTVILDHRSAAALLHEISHILDASYLYSRNIIGHKLSSDDVEVYDDPYNTDSPSIRFFDDEGVATRKRSLVENGVVRDLHHTRLTAKIAGSEPGSAYGLFHNPIPFHTTIIMKPGDWKYEEMLEDTKRGLYIVGIVMGTLEEGYVRLVPEYGYIIEDGELKEAVKIREIKIPFSSLKTINAISKEVKVRTSYEKYWCVSEIAPMLRLEAYVQ